MSMVTDTTSRTFSTRDTPNNHHLMTPRRGSLTSLKGSISPPSNVTRHSDDKNSSFLSDDDNNPFSEMFADAIAQGCFVKDADRFNDIEAARMRQFETEVPDGLKGFEWTNMDLEFEGITLK